MRTNRPTAKAAEALRAATAVLFLTAFLCRCATIGTPEGGPRDTLPPVITRLEPDNFTTDFDHDRIYIEFDEFVQLKDQQKEFFTSPQMKKKPTLSIRGKGIQIQLRDTLRENTTYALNFGGALCDNNEGNPLNGMRYVFSTGPEIDSMICSGYTADAYKADSTSKSFICFFPVDSVPAPAEYDSTLFKYKPEVIARAENNGIFIAQNLKPISYRVYAFQDTNDNQIYEPSIDLVGFLDQPCNPAEMADFSIWYDSIRRYAVADPQLYFRMFTDKAFKRQTLQDSKRTARHRAELRFGARDPQITRIEFDSIPASQVIVDPQGVNRDTVVLWFDTPDELLPDTIRGRITYLKHDSINRLGETTEELKLFWRYIETKAEERERERLERERKRAEEAGQTWEAPAKPSPFKYEMKESGEINPENHLRIRFEYPLRTPNTDSIRLTWTTEEDPEPHRAAVAFERDTADLRTWYLRTDWQQGGSYELFVPQGSWTDIANQSNDSIRFNYTVADPEKYAVIRVRVRGRSDTDKYIVQLLDGSGKLQQERRDVTTGEIRFDYVPAGQIRLRVIEDRNGNGVWDTGDLVHRIQPERAEIYVNGSGENTFITKVNWEMEIDMDMNELFAPVTMERLREQLEKQERQRLEELLKKQQDEQTKGRHENSRTNDGFGGGFGGMGGGLGGLGGGMGSLGGLGGGMGALH